MVAFESVSQSREVKSVIPSEMMGCEIYSIVKYKPLPLLLCALLWSWNGGGGVFAPNFTQSVVVNAHGVVQCTYCARFRCQNSRTISRKNGVRQMGVYPSQKQHFLSVFVAQKANSQLPPCTSIRRSAYSGGRLPQSKAPFAGHKTQSGSGHLPRGWPTTLTLR